MNGLDKKIQKLVDDEARFIINTTTNYIKVKHPTIYKKYLVGLSFDGKWYDEREEEYRDAIR